VYLGQISESVLCFLIRKSYVRSIKIYFFRKYTAILMMMMMMMIIIIITVTTKDGK